MNNSKLSKKHMELYKFFLDKILGFKLDWYIQTTFFNPIDTAELNQYAKGKKL